MKQLRRYWKIVTAVILVVIVVTAAIHAKQSQKPKVELQTAAAKHGDVLSSVSANGVFQAVTTVDVKSNVGGKVVELTVDEGDRVEAGQLIAKIDQTDPLANLDSAKADFSSYRSKVDQSKQALTMQQLTTTANIRSAEQALESSRQKLLQAGQQAKVQPRLTRESIRQAQSALESAQATLKQTRNALVPQQIASAKALYDQAQAAYVKAEKSVNREHALLEKGFVSKSDVDDAEAQYSEAKAQVESAKSKLDTIREQSDQDINSAEAKVRQASSELESALANKVQDSIKQQDMIAANAALKQAVANLNATRAAAYQDQMKREDLLQAQSQLQKSQASLKTAQTQVNYTTITAPRAGVVVKKYVEKGSIVTAGQQAYGGSSSGVTIVELADVSRMQVLAQVDETDIGKISMHQRVNVTVDACPGEKFPARVIKIAPQAVVNSNVTTVPVTVELDRADSRLKPAMNATCDFVVGSKSNVLAVPVEAVTETDNGKYVTVLDHDKQITRPVTVGLVGNDDCEIISGISEGETLVITDEEKSKKTTQDHGGPPPM